MIALIVLGVLIFAVGLLVGVALERRRSRRRLRPDDQDPRLPDEFLRADPRDSDRADVARGRGANTGLNF